MRSAPKEREELRARAEITSHFAAGPQARWRGASDELYPGRYVRSEQQSQRACGPQPTGARGAPATPAGVRIVVPFLPGGSLRPPPRLISFRPRWGRIRYRIYEIMYLARFARQLLGSRAKSLLNGRATREIRRVCPDRMAAIVRQGSGKLKSMTRQYLPWALSLSQSHPLCPSAPPPLWPSSPLSLLPVKTAIANRLRCAMLRKRRLAAGSEFRARPTKQRKS